ncbi:praja ring finger 2, E3 ubiquitin protein ligase S homeolog [Xenopus laevis]|uniref:RING-type E3 ubiquitin transferase n=1 Tax=Xenopus laevis TaxID=8355 RepID=Q6NUC4_XENLA|nr:praja ring finger 2, E3 ubiquitin protein ligase S homeolog [Xenopus laevis]AAH68671.1 MGC81063 protein [Xenopus laevis]
MGQEACKAAWPKSAGGSQTITGRRYGRRHAYVNFRPSLKSPQRASSQQIREYEGLELDDVQKEKDLISMESCDSPLNNISNIFTSDLQQDNNKLKAMTDVTSLITEVEEHGCSQSVCNSNFCKKNKTLTRHVPHKYQNGISFLNIDSFEPDSSEEEESCHITEDFNLDDETGKIEKSLENTFSDLYEVGTFCEMESEFRSKNPSCAKDRLSEMWPVSLCKSSKIDFGTTHGKWNVSMKSVSEDEATGVASLGISELQPRKNRTDITSKYSETASSSSTAEQDSLAEPVVRPKVRKQCTSYCSKNSILPEEGMDSSIVRKSNRGTRVKVESSCKDERSCPDMGSDNSHDDGSKIKIKSICKEQEYTDCHVDKPAVDDTFWDDFEIYDMKLSGSVKEDESSDCSDGEWSTCLPSYFSSDKEHSSSDESWETLPGKDEEHEHEVQSNSSSLEEENSDFCFQMEEQISLEDGEIPWLQYHEDIESSTDEENEIGNQFVHPGFFMLDGNNNLEDDSSLSEDLEVEWRLLDDFGDGLGVAQAMSYMDPQFLTYMALEERLAQAMETALAHLESLAVDVEQAHPPATKESIDCLPQIIINEDHNIVGQEQCCAICCSEYIKDEILTELPCHHLFHKPCVTLWLQKSGTCPVCRHVLASSLTDTAATSFLSDHESPPSIHSAAGTR